MAEDLFAHAAKIEAQAAIEAAERARKEAAEAARIRVRGKIADREAGLAEATRAELAAFVAGHRRLAGGQP